MLTCNCSSGNSCAGQAGERAQLFPLHVLMQSARNFSYQLLILYYQFDFCSFLDSTFLLCLGKHLYVELSLCCSLSFPLVRIYFGDCDISGDSLRSVRFGGRIPVASEIFRTRPDRPWSQPCVTYSGYQVSFPGAKRPGRGVDHPSPSGAYIKERVELYLYLPSEPSRPVRVYLTCTSTYLFQFISLLQPVHYHLTSSEALQHNHPNYYNIYQSTVSWVITLPKIIL